MQSLQFISYIVLLLLCFNVSCRALECKRNAVLSTITVDKTGKGKFPNILSAIKSIPRGNSQWIRVKIAPGIYKEKITIPVDKPCIFLEGAGPKLTIVDWAGHENTANGVTFTSYADYTVAKGITFKNNYNHPTLQNIEDGLTQAVAARIVGDKSAFYQCSFLGVQDTVWDDRGRHYFYNCFIEGGIDFIFGNGQSIYEGCELRYSMGIGNHGAEYYTGSITAQGRESANDPSGFVFKNCRVTGKGKVYLGRAWRPYSRVIFSNSVFSEAVFPLGWNAWHYVGQESGFTFAESRCSGPGSNMSRRVPWVKKLNDAALARFLHISFIDQEGWIPKLPTRPA